MEEVPELVHPGPIVIDALSRQHEHQSGLIWSGDHETCYTDLQCKYFRRNLFQCYSTAPCRLPLFRIQGEEGTVGSMILRAFTDSETDDDLILDARGFIFLLIGGHMLPDFSENLVHTSMLKEVDDMTSVVIQQPPTDPSQIAVCMVFIGGTLGCMPSQHDIQHTFPVQPSCRRPREHVPNRGTLGVKRGARRQLGRGAGGGRPPILPIPHRHEHVDSEHVEVERGEGSGGGLQTVDPFDSSNLDVPSFSLDLTPASQSLPSGSGTSQTSTPPGLEFASFQVLHSTSFSFSGFRAPPPSGTVGSSTPHQPISQASSFDEEERADDMDGVQHYEFGHHVGKKTTRFTPSDWP
ncbi:hypothetical protein M9H77_17822 [Catharanthus roseus]|uniref:Uncharacterized protein n=1 Tax=Catharanthus roseus TaxID=4058 RepID=A0ACC0B5P7_CATRO|nr:hypothetical protein M9H77_17822 [Catharanthus roseus]